MGRSTPSSRVRATATRPRLPGSRPRASPGRSAQTRPQTHAPLTRPRTRALILAAAERVFAAQGLAGARTEAIAAAAGVNKAMLYYYFRDKDRLYEAVLEEHFREFNRQALVVLAAPGPARQVLLRYVGLHFDFIAQRRRNAALFQQLLLAGGAPLERMVRKYFLPRTAALGKLLRRGVREGEFRRADPLHAGITLAATIVFYFSAARVLELLGHSDPYSDANLRRRRAEVIDFIRYGLFSNPQAPVAAALETPTEAPTP